MNHDYHHLKVVHDNDLEGFLETIGELRDVKEGNRKCKYCRSVITMENLHSVFRQSGDIKYVCDDPTCIEKLLEFINEKIK